MRIDPVIQNLFEGTNSLKKTEPSGQGSFAEHLGSKISEVNQLQNRADEAIKEGTVKGASSVHQTMIRLEEADLGLRLLSKVRNKALDAYNEIMRMQF
ncbi:MAG: flagellar hook-basal body complex protein FliE [Syntrophobacteraceae bacterium]